MYRDKIILLEICRYNIDVVPHPSFDFTAFVHQMKSHVRFAVFCHGHGFFLHQEDRIDLVTVLDLAYIYLAQNTLLPLSIIRRAILSAALIPSRAELMIPPA